MGGVLAASGGVRAPEKSQDPAAKKGRNNDSAD
jgi:hypothetical protein